ncbi:FAD:protein FMN transferase [Flavihumibacter petaseus]|uniref:FAD:protein FMN transferase n=1 Tax=Flavihumibacter petaseus NBRC 106054 TaxID=1220578 RepID=A0A0E9N5G6_9BACT|nr:FAD:protein FMN transferase [Flavihumibacter petaseus]GAO44585.1 hypothetical protein FPE01S_03_06230 [Flavihumibacter petaseus NBRC 106054]
MTDKPNYHLQYLLPLLILLAFATNLHAQPKKYAFSREKMGSPFGITLYSEDSVKAARVAENCFSLVDSLVFIFSDYIDSSELNRLAASSGNPAGFTCSPALFDIINQAAGAWKASRGTFDITLGPLTRLWRKSRREKTWPDSTLVNETRRRCGFEHVTINTQEHKVYLKQPHMLLDLGGIAQGYIAKEVLNRTLQLGIRTALIDVSGDISVSDPPPGRPGWRISINLPESEESTLPDNLVLRQQSVTTSGDVYQHQAHNGKRYSHIVDPRTGYGSTNMRNVTVIAKDAVVADWLTKAGTLLKIKKAKKLAIKLQAEILITSLQDGKLEYHATKGFSQYWEEQN